MRQFQRQHNDDYCDDDDDDDDDQDDDDDDDDDDDYNDDDDDDYNDDDDNTDDDAGTVSSWPCVSTSLWLRHQSRPQRRQEDPLCRVLVSSLAPQSAGSGSSGGSSASS